MKPYKLEDHFSLSRIQVNCPSDPKSRWLSDGSRLPQASFCSASRPTLYYITLSLHMAMDMQYITVELARPAVVFSVSFGKFEKSHACNLRKFSVYGGMECDRMHLLCEG